MNNNITIAASILTANFLKLTTELDAISAAKIPAIHFDVMDGHFVPNLTFGPKILTDVSDYCWAKNMVIDCHLMVEIKANISIKEYLEPYIKKNVNSITLHYEALTQQQRTEFLNWKAPFKKGLAISPNTRIDVVFPNLSKLDLVLIMSVNPGFGNQKFIDTTLAKIKALKQKLQTSQLSEKIIIGVDGGINDVTGRQCWQAGANYLVSGSYLLNSTNSIAEQLAKLLADE